MTKKISSALISVYDKNGLLDLLHLLRHHHIKIYTTGGTEKFARQNGFDVIAIESITDYPSILDGRVKTLHPKIFGGILAKRNENHLVHLEKYQIPAIDLVVVDLYPFEETLKHTDIEDELIEKIDIGGISLLRAGAKNYTDVVIIPSKDEYPILQKILQTGEGFSTIEERKYLAAKAFQISSHYDSMIFNFFNSDGKIDAYKLSVSNSNTLRYGENPHQVAKFYGKIEEKFVKLGGKEISYNNLVDIDAAVEIINSFPIAEGSVFCILKHTNPCGIALRDNSLDAFNAALECDPTSAFGGVIICNDIVDETVANRVNTIFYEVLIAPVFTEQAIKILCSKKNRILLQLKDQTLSKNKIKTVLNGFLIQGRDTVAITKDQLKLKTKSNSSEHQIEELLFANKCVKHLKSNAICITKNKQILGMGCGQTSRIDATIQAIEKAKKLGFDLKDSVLASDAFFPFPDSIEIAHKAGIRDFVQPGGSVNDRLCEDYCNEHGLAMYYTNIRHFLH